jgi:hypothetical protein
VSLQRQVYDNWVPKKLEVEIQMEEEKSIDFERFRGNKGVLQSGEEEIK